MYIGTHQKSSRQLNLVMLIVAILLAAVVATTSATAKSINNNNPTSGKNGASLKRSVPSNSAAGQQLPVAAADLEKAQLFCSQLASYSQEFDDYADLSDYDGGGGKDGKGQPKEYSESEKLCLLLRLLSPLLQLDRTSLHFVVQQLSQAKIAQGKPPKQIWNRAQKRARGWIYDDDYGSAELGSGGDSFMKKLDYLFGHEGIRYKKSTNNNNTSNGPKMFQWLVPAGVMGTDLFRHLTTVAQAAARAGTTPTISPTTPRISLVPSAAAAAAPASPAESQYSPLSAAQSYYLSMPTSSSSSSSSGHHAAPTSIAIPVATASTPTTIPIFNPEHSLSHQQPHHSRLISEINRESIQSPLVHQSPLHQPVGGNTYLMFTHRPATPTSASKWFLLKTPKSVESPRELALEFSNANLEPIRFVKKNPFDKEGIRFKRSHGDDSSFESMSFPFANEGIRFKKSPFDAEGIRFKKSPFDAEGIRFKKSPFDEEGIRFKKASPFMDEGIRYKKTPFDAEGIRFKKSPMPFAEEGIRFKKSPFDEEGIRF